MTILVVVLVVVLVLVAAAVTARRRRGSEAHTVAGYRRTLDTLAGLSRTPGTRRLLGGRQEGPPSTPDAPAEEGGGLGGPGPGPDPSRRWAFDDVGSGQARVRPPGVGPRRHDIGRALRGPPRGSRPRIALVAVATAAVAVVVVVVVLAGGHHPKANGAGATGSTSPTTHGTHGTPTTTTTLPAREQPASSTPNTATYVAPTATYVLTLGATTGNCWIQVTDASGTTAFAQTVSAGTRHAVTVSGRVTVLLGAPTSAAVAVDHVPTVLPTGYGAPFTMTFTPSSAAG